MWFLKFRSGHITLWYLYRQKFGIIESVFVLKRPALPPRSKPQRPATNWRNCPSCKRIRAFLLLAAVILVAMWTQPELALPPGFDYPKLIGDLFAVVFVVLLVWQIWRYIKERQAGKHNDGLTWMGTPRRPPPRTPEEQAALAERARQEAAARQSATDDAP